jgi:hypothetical protein
MMLMPQKKCVRYRTIEVGKGRERGYAHICVRKTKGRRGGYTEITPSGIHHKKLKRMV